VTDDSQNILFGNGDELPSNHSANPHIQDVINQGRRKVVASGAAFGALAFLGGLPSIAGAAEPAKIGSGQPFQLRNRLPFGAVPVTRADTITVPAGFSAKAPFWKTPATVQKTRLSRPACITTACISSRWTRASRAVKVITVCSY
jgi:hypothetical protein